MSSYGMSVCNGASALWVAVAALLLLGSPASAEPAGPDYARKGWYVGANGIYGLYVFDQGKPVETDGTGGFNVRGGYRIYPWLAAELFYEWAYQFTKTPAGAPITTDAMSHTITTNLKFLYPRWRAQPYFAFGIGAYGEEETTQAPAGVSNSSEWGLGMRPVVGVDFYLTENVVLNLETGPSIGLYDAATDARIYMSFGGGVQYRF